VAQTNDLRAQLAVGSLAAAGSANLVNDALNMKLSAVFNKGFADKVGGTKVGGFLSTVLANPSGELVVPAIVTGTTKQPKFSPDLQAVAELQKQRLLPTLADPKSGLGGILGAFTGKTPAQPAPATNELVAGGQPAPAAAPAEPPKPVERITGILGGLLGGKKNPLAGTSWQWEKVAGSGKTETPKDPSKFVLAFAADGKLSSSTDCNRLTGSYTADDSKLSVGALAGTRMACGESQESAYSTALAAAASYSISGDTLSIRLRDASVMTFKRAK
jgi:heat shock protein HslJ